MASWSANLIDQSATGDDDKDGIINLLEYAFGGDPTTASLQMNGGNTRLFPHYERIGDNMHTLSYIRRKD